MKILTRDDTDHNTEYVTLADYRELEASAAELRAKVDELEAENVQLQIQATNAKYNAQHAEAQYLTLAAQAAELREALEPIVLAERPKLKHAGPMGVRES